MDAMLLRSRRRLGPAYEQTPAEQTGRWLRDHCLRVLATAAALALFWLGVNWGLVNLANFLHNLSYEQSARPFSASHPVLAGLRIVGSLVLGYYLLFRFRMQARF
jgi:H+/Cl- antiporter ClcA